MLHGTVDNEAQQLCAVKSMNVLAVLVYSIELYQESGSET